MTDEDRKFVNGYLDYFERKYFYALKESEQKHSVRVAILALERCKDNLKINAKRIVKAAILHDIGKSVKKINIIQKVIMVLSTNVFGDRVKNLEFIDFVNSYYNHGEIGYNILKNHIYDDKLLFIVRNHHSDIDTDEELSIIRYCDSKN